MSLPGRNRDRIGSLVALETRVSAFRDDEESGDILEDYVSVDVKASGDIIG
jgi:hypothetical protein